MKVKRSDIKYAPGTRWGLEPRKVKSASIESFALNMVFAVALFIFTLFTLILLIILGGAIYD